MSWGSGAMSLGVLPCGGGGGGGVGQAMTTSQSCVILGELNEVLTEHI